MEKREIKKVDTFNDDMEIISSYQLSEVLGGSMCAECSGCCRYAAGGRTGGDKEESSDKEEEKSSDLR